MQGLAIHSDGRGVVAELALDRDGSIVPHSNPNLTYFLVIEGGGFVRVGEETARVSAGDAVLWPPDVVHAAWTDLTPMRAIVVEFAGTDRQPPLLEAGAELVSDEPVEGDSMEAAGSLESETAREGEPW